MTRFGNFYKNNLKCIFAILFVILPKIQFMALCSVFLKDLFILSYIWVVCFHVYLCTTCMPSALRGQQTFSVSLELELWLIVSLKCECLGWNLCPLKEQLALNCWVTTTFVNFSRLFLCPLLILYHSYWYFMFPIIVIYLLSSSTYFIVFLFLLCFLLYFLV